MYSRMRPQEDGSIITILPAAVNLTQPHIGGIVCWALIRASKWSSALTRLPDSNRIQLFIWCKIQLAFHLHVPWRWRSEGCRLAGASRRTLQHEANAVLRLHRPNREDFGQGCSSPGRWLLWKETFGMRQRGLRNRMNLPNDSLLGEWGRKRENEGAGMSFARMYLQLNCTLTGKWKLSLRRSKTEGSQQTRVQYTGSGIQKWSSESAISSCLTSAN